MAAPYYDATALIERLHRHFLDVVKLELDRANIQDINSVQALILYNIGGDELTVGELTMRGYYLGSNVSYNVKKLAENDYIAQERSIHDRRSVRVRLTRKGADLRERISNMYERHVSKLGTAGLQDKELTQMIDTLMKLERFWSNQIDYAAFGAVSSVA